jgi:hypothetical protein
MQVLLKTAPVGGVTGRRPDGTAERGSAYFVATLYMPGEALPPGTRAVPLSRWRQDGYTKADGSMHIPAPAFFTPDRGVSIPEAVLPAESLRILPEGAQIELEWRIVHGHGGAQ